MHTVVHRSGVVLVLAVALSGGAPQVRENAVSVSGGSGTERPFPIDALLIEKADLPASSVKDLSLRSQNPDVTDIEILDTVGAKEYRVRSWIDGEGARPAGQIVYGFSDPARADADYKEFPNGRNFHISDGLHAIPVDIGDLRLGADKANAFCVDFDTSKTWPEDCSQWGFRALYRRYVVDVILRRGGDGGNGRRVGRDVFMEFVAAIDRHVRKEMGE